MPSRNLYNLISELKLYKITPSQLWKTESNAAENNAAESNAVENFAAESNATDYHTPENNAVESNAAENNAVVLVQFCRAMF